MQQIKINNRIRQVIELSRRPIVSKDRQIGVVVSKLKIRFRRLIFGKNTTNMPPYYRIEEDCRPLFV